MALTLPLLALVPTAAPADAATTYEKAYAAYQADAVIVVLRENFVARCQKDTDGNAGSANQEELASTASQARAWAYSAVPNTFPGNAASSSPTSDQTTTAERLAAAIETSVPGSPPVKAGVSVRPLALKGLEEHRDVQAKMIEVSKLRKRLDGENKRYEEKKAFAARAESDASEKETRATGSRALIESKRPQPECVRRDSWIAGLFESLLCEAREKDVARDAEVEALERSAVRARGLATQASMLATEAKLVRDELEGQVKKGEKELRVLARTKPARWAAWGRRVGESWTLRVGTFEDLAVRAGSGISLPLGLPNTEPPLGEITEADFDRALEETFDARCEDLTADWVDLRIRSYFQARAKAFTESCRVVGKRTETQHAELAQNACTLAAVEKQHAKARLTLLADLGEAAHDLGCLQCATLEDPPPTLETDVEFVEIEKAAVAALKQDYIRNLAWSHRDWRASLDVFVDFEPLSFGFAPRDDEGTAARLGRGAWRRLGGAASFTRQGNGSLLSLTLGPSATREVEDNTLQDERWALAGEVRFQCVFGSLDRKVRLGLRREEVGSYASEKPRIACARGKAINPAALSEKAPNAFKLGVPHVGWFLAIGAAVHVQPETFEQSPVREATASTGFDFIISDKLKFRLGVPVRLALVQQEAEAAASPGPVVPLARGLQLSVPVFVTTVLAL